MTTNIKKASPYGARRVVAAFDTIANLVQAHYQALGIPEKIAKDYALRTDMLSDAVTSYQGKKYASFFDPSTIAEEVPGPLQNDASQPFMAGHFTQEWFNALADKQMSGELASAAAAHKADPKLAALLHKVATEAAVSATIATLRSLGRVAGDEPAKAEEPEAKKAGEDPAKAEDDKAAGEDEEAAQKSAALFGLFADK